MKRLGLFSIMLLAGCVPTQKEYTIIRETSRPVEIQPEEQIEIQKNIETQVATQIPATQQTVTVNQAQDTLATPCQQMGQNGGPACLQPAPTYFAGTYNKPQGMYQTQQHIAYQSGGCGGQVMCGQNLSSTLGGTMMHMPSQTMTVAPMPVQMPVQAQIPQAMTMPVANPVVQTEMFYETQTLPMSLPAMPIQMPAQIQPATLEDVTSVVILQHPVNRDLVKCSVADTNCLIAYEAQGYVQLRNTAYGNTHTHVDYTVNGTWQNNNNIPRW